MDYDQLQNIQKSDQPRIEEYMKTKIQEIFNLAQDEKVGFVKKIHIPIIMRYLITFPSDAQIAEVIIPELEDEEDSEYISYQKFEPYMLKVLREKEFQPDESEILMAAFKMLDQENNGYIDLQILKNSLEKDGIEFKEDEIESFVAFATNGDENATVVYYEDYISRLNQVIEKQRDTIMKNLSNFVMPKNV